MSYLISNSNSMSLLLSRSRAITESFLLFPLYIPNTEGIGLSLKIHSAYFMEVFNLNNICSISIR